MIKVTCYEITNIGRVLEKAVRNPNEPRHGYRAVFLERLRASKRKAKSGNATHTVTRMGKQHSKPASTHAKLPYLLKYID